MFRVGDLAIGWMGTNIRELSSVSASNIDADRVIVTPCISLLLLCLRPALASLSISPPGPTIKQCSEVSLNWTEQPPIQLWVVPDRQTVPGGPTLRTLGPINENSLRWVVALPVGQNFSFTYIRLADQLTLLSSPDQYTVVAGDSSACLTSASFKFETSSSPTPLPGVTTSSSPSLTDASTQTPSASLTRSQTAPGTSSINVGIVTGATIGGVGGLSLLGILIFLLRRRTRRASIFTHDTSRLLIDLEPDATDPQSGTGAALANGTHTSEIRHTPTGKVTQPRHPPPSLYPPSKNPKMLWAQTQMDSPKPAPSPTPAPTPTPTPAGDHADTRLVPRAHAPGPRPSEAAVHDSKHDSSPPARGAGASVAVAVADSDARYELLQAEIARLREEQHFIIAATVPPPRYEDL